MHLEKQKVVQFGLVQKKDELIMRIIDVLKSDFVNEINNEYGSKEANSVLNEEVTNDLAHSLQLRPGDSFSFYSLPLYVVTRIVKPSIVIETGVQNGGSTQTILAALNQNKKGTLHSIDSGDISTDGTHKSTSNGLPGQNVSNHLRDRWKLHIGFTFDVFPKLLPEIDLIDLFFHDSDHSKENVEYEFNAIKTHLNKNGLVGLHDHYGQWDHETILPANEYKFCIGKDRPATHSLNGEYHNVLRLWKKI